MAKLLGAESENRKGGARPGAGRKKGVPTKVVRLNAQLAEVLQRAIALRPLPEIIAALDDFDSCNKNQSSPLNPDQQKAVEVLLAWFEGEEKSAALSGAAGTGKTYSVGYFVKRLEGVKPLFIVPTHKAKKMLKQLLKKSGVAGECYTVAQALGKQPIVKRDGTEDFDKLNATLISGAKLVICDEASMVNKDDHKEIMESSCKKILWMGDRYQLPPVKESISLAFSETATKAELLKVMRYSGHILEECQKLRKAVDRESVYVPRPDGNTVVSVSRRRALALAVNLFKSEEFDRDSSYCRWLAFRNRKVDFCNENLKSLVFGHSKVFFKGQRLIATRPIVRLVPHSKRRDRAETMILAVNSEEMEVVSEPIDRKINSDDLALAPFFCQKLTGTITTFKCLAESGNTFWARCLSRDAEDCKQNLFLQAKRKGDRKAMGFLHSWGDSLKDIFALTVHKSQGSTFNHVFVDIEDILDKPKNMKPGEKDQRPQLLYTAFSRASEKVYLVEGCPGENEPF